MSKKILAISSSFRKGGNSDTLCDQFIRGAQEAGNEVEKIFVNDYKINFCRGCGACNITHKCVQKDDMAVILDKMIEADVIVLATPVYFYNMNGQMKTLIDRTVPRYEEMRNKDFYYILAAADESPPVRIPIAPCSSMLLRTPSASSAPNPLSGTVAPDDANPMIFSYIPVAPRMTPAHT